MSRPIGVTLIAVALLGFSLWTLYQTLTHPVAHRGRAVLIVSVLLAALGFVAAQALWTLRSHAFSMFVIWALCAMVAIVMTRLGGLGGAHAIRVFQPIVYTGIAFVVAALYLRRAV